MSNPYSAPKHTGDCDATADAGRSKTLRFQTALLLAGVGVACGAAFCSVGYLFLVFVLEAWFVPPFKSPPNYGQFSFLLFYFGFVGLFYGASFGLLPYTRFPLWVVVFLLIMVITTPSELVDHFDALDVVFAAMLITGASIFAATALTSWILQRCNV